MINYVALRGQQYATIVAARKLLGFRNFHARISSERLRKERQPPKSVGRIFSSHERHKLASYRVNYERRNTPLTSYRAGLLTRCWHSFYRLFDYRNFRKRAL